MTKAAVEAFPRLDSFELLDGSVAYYFRGFRPRHRLTSDALNSSYVRFIDKFGDLHIGGMQVTNRRDGTFVELGDLWEEDE